MKNWKTTLSGIVTAVGTALAASDNHIVKGAGVVIGILGAVFLGASAKDKNVTGGTTQQ